MSWEIVKVKDVSAQIRGVSYKPQDASDFITNNHLAVLRANNITENGIKLDDLIYVNNECISEKQKLKVGDILIAASSGSKHIVGRAIFINDDIEASFGAFCKVVRPNHNVLSEYLGFYFKSPDYRRIISSLSLGANINNIRNEDIDNLQIPLPPLSTQKRIAEILDKADALRKADQQLLKYYDQLAQSLFIKLFGDPVKNEKGWEVKSGKQIFSLLGGAAFKSSEYEEAGIPLIRIGAINKGYFDKSQLIFLPESFEQRFKKYLVYPNDLLMTLTGTVGKEDYGNPFTLGNEFDKYFLNQRVAKITVPVEFNLVYFKYFFKQKSIKNQLIGVSRGVRQANISNEDFYKLNVISPPIEIQNQFATQIQNIEQQKETLKVQIQASEHLFQSLLKQAFNGGLN